MNNIQWQVLLFGAAISLASLSTYAADPASENELQTLRNQFYAEEKALTQEWNSRASQPGVDKAQLEREMKAKHDALRKHYEKVDPRGPYLDRIDSKLAELDGGGMQTESTGGSPNKKPKHIGADADLKLTNKDGSPVSPERVDQGLAVITQDARENSLSVDENAARVDVRDQEVTGWRSSSPEGRAATQNDPDANVTTGGLEATRNPGEIRDEQGAFKDLESKYETARANCDLKTMGKCVAKAADNQGSTRARVIEGEDGKTFDLREGVDKDGNPTYDIPRDPKPGNNEALVDKARGLQNYETTNEAGVTTPGAGEQVNRIEIESAMNDMDQEMAQLRDKATKKGELRQTVRENFAESYDQAGVTGSGEAGNRTRLNPETGEYETGRGGQQLREEIDRVNRTNAMVDDQKINPGKQVPTGTDPFTGGNRPTGEPPAPLFSDPELQAALSEAELGAASAPDTRAPADMDASSPVTSASDAPETSGSRPVNDVDTNKPPSSLLDGGKASASSQGIRGNVNNLTTNIDDAAEAAMEAVTGESMSRSSVDPDTQGNAGTLLGVGMTAANAYGAMTDLNDAAAAQEKADKAGEQYDSALESNRFDDALRANDEQFRQQTTADDKSTKGGFGAASTVGGLVELADGVLDTPANALGAAGSSVGVALDGFQAGNSLGKAEQARRSMERAQAHAATLRSRGLEEQAQRYDQIAAQNYETLLSEGEAATGGAIKTGVGILAASGSAVAAVGAGAYGITRAGIERTAPGKALEEGKANLGARIIEWWYGAPEQEAEAIGRVSRVAQLREGLASGEYSVTEGIDKNDIEGILATAERTGDFTHITAVLDREPPSGSKGGYEDKIVPEPGKPVAPIEEHAEIYELLDALEADIDKDSGAISRVQPQREIEYDNDFDEMDYSDHDVLAALGQDVNDTIYDEYRQPQASDYGSAYATLEARSGAMSSERARQQSAVARQGRDTDQAMAAADLAHRSSMSDLSTELQERAELRDTIASAVSSGINSGVYGAGRRVGDALGRDALGETGGGCGGCGGGGEDHDHDENGNDVPRGSMGATGTNNGGSRNGGNTGSAATGSGNQSSSGGGGTPACDRIDRMIDELFTLQNRFINSEGTATVQPRHDELILLINDDSPACSQESPSRNMELFRRLQNSPLARAGQAAG